MKFLLAIFLSTFLFFGAVSADGHDQANSFAIALKVPEAEINRVEAFFDSHREFMKTTHSVNGDQDLRLNSYAVIKGPEFVNPMDPSQGTTGFVFYILAEHYETPNGLKKHFEAGSKWKGIEEMNAIIGKYAVGMTYPGYLVSNMNR